MVSEIDDRASRCPVPDRERSTRVQDRPPMRSSPLLSSKQNPPLMSPVAAPNNPAAAPALSPGLWRRGLQIVGRPETQEVGLSLFDQAIVSGTNFVTSVLIGRAAGADSLGVYALALSVVLIARAVQEQLVSGPYAVNCQRKDPRQAARFLGSVLVHHLLMSGATAVVMSVLGFALHLGHGPQGLNSLIWLLVAVTPAILFRELLRQVAFAQLRPGLAVAIDATVAVAQLGGLGLLAWCGMLTVAGAFSGIAAGCLLAIAGWFFWMPVKIRVSLPRIQHDWRENWVFGRWALASQLVASAGLYIMPWVVAAVDGEEATGLFAAGGTIVGIANMFVLGMANYLTPKAARAYATGGVPALERILKMLALLFSVTLGGFALAAALIGDFAAGLVYGKEFAAAGNVIAVLALGMWTNALAITAGNGLWAVGKPEANFRADVVSFVVTVAATAILVPLFSTVGAAASLLAGGGTSMVVRYAILRSVLNQHRVLTANAEGDKP